MGKRLAKSKNDRHSGGVQLWTPPFLSVWSKGWQNRKMIDTQEVCSFGPRLSWQGCVVCVNVPCPTSPCLPPSDCGELPFFVYPFRCFRRFSFFCTVCRWLPIWSFALPASFCLFYLLIYSRTPPAPPLASASLAPLLLLHCRCLLFPSSLPTWCLFSWSRVVPRITPCAVRVSRVCGCCCLAPGLVPWLWPVACLPCSCTVPHPGPVAAGAPVGFPVAVVPSLPGCSISPVFLDGQA